VLPPAGRFVARLNPEQACHYAAIAAGSGITPVLSIIGAALEIEARSRCTLIYANRNMGSIMFLEELQDLKNRFPDRFAMYHVLSREPQAIDLFSGRLGRTRLNAFLDTVVLEETVDHWYLCGPFSMVDELAPALTERGVDPRHIHRELFHADAVSVRPHVSETAETGQDLARVRIVLDGRESTLDVARFGEPILEALLRVREDAPYACKGGVCGTCRARLVEGEVDMDQNYALELDEQQAGFVLACQSHPRTERVTLDFDT
jgi:ring-1,2-phenylacetyl-CoA epoxidase subunit PaaE